MAGTGLKLLETESKPGVAISAARPSNINALVPPTIGTYRITEKFGRNVSIRKTAIKTNSIAARIPTAPAVY
jgi:hypothetical protein